MRPFAQDVRGAFLIEVDHAGEAVLRGGTQLLPEIVERRGGRPRAGQCGNRLGGGGAGAGQQSAVPPRS